ncbi:BTAD domain-containing putative transcriptional regulator [Cryptosporangium sp. NPDC051539]|uniref:AfsR/SARP family transcriptional regulator n=1 Tax=Cryptosporangium sp. NPDC051539 TaxID=3363962 RepID=UPI0037AB3823
MTIDTVPTPLRRGRLRLFDGFRLEAGGDEIEFGTSAQRLLAFLALNGPSTRTVVAGRLWGDVSEERAQGSLRTTIWRIGRKVSWLVRSEYRRLSLSDAVTVDVAEFSQDAFAQLRNGSSANGARNRLAVQELLPGWYDDWVVFERDRLRQLDLHARESRANELYARGEFGLALNLALEAVSQEPLRESVRKLAIHIHLAEGNTAEAIREYRRYRQLLVEQLGVEPSRELANLCVGLT